MAAVQQKRPGLMGRYSIEDGRGKISTANRVPDFETLLASGASLRVNASLSRDVEMLASGSRAKGKEAALRDIEQEMEKEEAGGRWSEDGPDQGRDAGEAEGGINGGDGQRTVRAASMAIATGPSLVDEAGFTSGPGARKPSRPLRSPLTGKGNHGKPLPIPPQNAMAPVSGLTDRSPSMDGGADTSSSNDQSNLPHAIMTSSTGKAIPMYDLSGGLSGVYRETQVARSRQGTGSSSFKSALSSTSATVPLARAPSTGGSINGSVSVPQNPPVKMATQSSVTPEGSSTEIPRARAGIILSDMRSSSRRNSSPQQLRYSVPRRQDLSPKPITRDNSQYSADNEIHNSKNIVQKGTKAEDSVSLFIEIVPDISLLTYLFPSSLWLMLFEKRVASSRKGSCGLLPNCLLPLLPTFPRSTADPVTVPQYPHLTPPHQVIFH